MLWHPSLCIRWICSRLPTVCARGRGMRESSRLAGALRAREHVLCVTGARRRSRGAARVLLSFFSAHESKSGVRGAEWSMVEARARKPMSSGLLMQD